MCEGSARLKKMPSLSFYLKIVGTQSKRMVNNDVIIPKNDDSIFKISQGSIRLKVNDFKMILR